MPDVEPGGLEKFGATSILGTGSFCMYAGNAVLPVERFLRGRAYVCC